MVSAGRVLIIPKGAWNTTDTYSMLDLVSYNGSSYVAKTSVPANTLPTNTSYWQLSAYGGTAATIAGNFAPLEPTEYASQGYAIGEFLVNKDNQFCVATSVITTGDEIIVKPSAGYNVEATDVGTEINRIDDTIDNLSASDISYDGTTSGLTATDPQSAIDEVVGSLSTVATTGAYSDLSGKPTLGTAAAKNSTNSVTELSTDLVESGAVYTALLAKANTSDLGTAAAKNSTNEVTSGSTDLVESGAVYTYGQPKTLDTPLTVDGTQETTVEGALGAINTQVSDLDTDVTSLDNDKAEKADLSSIIQTGSTATQAISKESFFYLNGTLVKAKTAIANGATFSLNTNYEVVTAGGLNDLVNGFKGRVVASITADGTKTLSTLLNALYSSISSLTRDELARTRFRYSDFDFPFYLKQVSTGNIYYGGIFNSVASNPMYLQIESFSIGDSTSKSARIASINRDGQHPQVTVYSSNTVANGTVIEVIIY